MSSFKVLIVEDDDLLSESIEALVKTVSKDIVVITAFNIQQACSAIDQNPDLTHVLCDYNMPGGNGSRVYFHLCEKEMDAEYILVSTLTPDMIEEFQGVDIEFVKKPDILQILKYFEPKSEYIRIPHRLLMASPRFDTLLRSESGQFQLAIQHSDEKFSEKLESMKDTPLYLKAEDAKSIMDFLFDHLIHQSGEDDFKYLVLQTAVKLFGGDEATVAFAEKTAADAMINIQSNSELCLALKGIMSGSDKSYISSRSRALAVLSCYLAQRIGMTSRQCQQLSLASLLHDSDLESDELARLDTLKQVEDANLEESVKIAYLKHPTNTASIIRKYSSFPLSVASIVEQHHEQEDGSGFPAGIAADSFDKICALFRMCHGILNELEMQSFKVSDQQVSLFLRNNYTQGIFGRLQVELSHLIDS